MEKKNKRKVLASLFVAITLFSTIYGILMKPQPAKAIWTVADILGPLENINEHTIYSALEDVVKTFVIKFTYNDIIKWISGEKSGKPAFISDFDDWLFKQADEAASQFLEQMLGVAYQTLCTGINVNLALFWKTQFDVAYYVPKCTLSQIQQRFQNPGTEWVDFQASLNDSNNDAGYLFQVYSKADQKKRDIQFQKTITAISGQGYASVEKDKDGKEIVKTPGSAIAGLVNASQKAPFDIVTSSNSWTQISTGLMQAIIITTLQRGIKTLKTQIKK